MFTSIANELEAIRREGDSALAEIHRALATIEQVRARNAADQRGALEVRNTALPAILNALQSDRRHH